MRRGRLLALAAIAATGTGVALAAGPNDEVGPQTLVQPNGRRVAPVGDQVALGNHPGGAAVTKDGRWLWTLSSGRGVNDIRIVDMQTAKVIQKIPMPGTDGGIAMAPDAKTVYVSGTPDSSHKDQKAPPGTPGLNGDTIHVFTYDATTGAATRHGTIDVPPPSGSPDVQNFPPTPGHKRAWPRDIAVSPDGKTLITALNLADRAAIVDTKTKSVRYVQTGSYPYGAAITTDGKTGLISNESDGTVSVIDLASGTKTKDIQVGAHLSHPEAIAIDPASPRAYVAVAHEDTVVVIDTRTMTVERRLSVERSEGVGSEPTALSVTAEGSRLLVADSGEDAIAVFALSKPLANPRPNGTRACVKISRTVKGKASKQKKKHKKKHRRKRRHRPRVRRDETVKQRHRTPGAVQVDQTSCTLHFPPENERPAPFTLVGRIPTAAYPVAAGASPGVDRMAWVTAKGNGVGPNPNGPNPLSPDNSDDKINTFRYLPSIIDGSAGVLTFPGDQRVRALTPAADAEIHPINGEAPPPGTPLDPAAGKIKHVFYIVRENRTYDQVLGDAGRGASDPSLELFPASITPNAHALAARFPLLDHVFANSEASIDGHFWTSAAAVSDYVTKNWHQNYGGRDRPYDFGVYSVTWPAARFLLDQAERQGISYFNYGEAIAGTVPLTDKDRTPTETQQVGAKFAKSDLGSPDGCYPNDAYIGKNAISQQNVYDADPPPSDPTAESRFNCFKNRFTIQDATGQVPAFNMMVLSNDHTRGLSPGARTPQAMVADNDWALGKIVDLISHSSVWDSSLILVVEDDSQDGADHVDAHRIPAFAISPYAKPGAVVQTRYDFPSVIRSAELPIGMAPLNLFDALATPMYDAFDATRTNQAAYTALKPAYDVYKTNPNTAANRRAMKGLNLSTIDQVRQRDLDRVLWQAVHGPRSKPPPPGPNAVHEQAPDPDG